MDTFSPGRSNRYLADGGHDPLHINLAAAFKEMKSSIDLSVLMSRGLVRGEEHDTYLLFFCNYVLPLKRSVALSSLTSVSTSECTG